MISELLYTFQDEGCLVIDSPYSAEKLCHLLNNGACLLIGSDIRRGDQVLGRVIDRHSGVQWDAYLVPDA